MKKRLEEIPELNMQTYKAKVASLLHILGRNIPDLELDTKKKVA